MRVLMLAVSLDVLPNISSRRKFKSPTRTHRISRVRARCPSEHHKVLVINLPNRSTALTCRRTEHFVQPHYTQFRQPWQAVFEISFVWEKRHPPDPLAPFFSPREKGKRADYQVCHSEGAQRPKNLSFASRRMTELAPTNRQLKTDFLLWYDKLKSY